MTSFSVDSTIFEKVSIDYDNKVDIYDDYGDDMYAINSNITMKLIIVVLIFNWIMPLKYRMIVLLLSLLPLL